MAKIRKGEFGVAKNILETFMTRHLEVNGGKLKLSDNLTIFEMERLIEILNNFNGLADYYNVAEVRKNLKERYGEFIDWGFTYKESRLKNIYENTVLDLWSADSNVQNFIFENLHIAKFYFIMDLLVEAYNIQNISIDLYNDLLELANDGNSKLSVLISKVEKTVQKHMSVNN